MMWSAHLLTASLWSLLTVALTQTDLSLRALCSDFWAWKVGEFPELAAHDSFNLDSEELESFTFEAFTNRVARCQSFLERAEAIPRESLDREDQITLDILVYHFRAYIDGYQWKDFSNLNPVNFMEGIHRGGTAWVYGPDYRTPEDFHRYIRRLDKLPRQMVEIQNLLEKAVQLGRTNHRVSMENVISEMYEKSRVPAEATPYYAPFRDDLERATNMTQHQKKSLKSQGVASINRLLAALRTLTIYIETRYMTSLRTAPGVGSWSQGAEYYRAVLKWHLTLDMDPEEVHRIGLAEVSRIRENMENVMGWLGFQGNLTQFLHHLRREKRFYNHTKEELLAGFKDAVYNRIMPRLPMLFHNLSTIPNLSVVEMPQDGIAAAYGNGVFWINTNRPHTRPSYVTLALSLHEGSHHLQVSYTKQQPLPNFRRHTWVGKKYPAPFHFPYFTAYAEGWGLYAEYLGEEMGLFQDPYEMFGRYCYEMLRACRLVVDTGLHVKGWSQEEAVNYLMRYTILNRKSLETEVARYITWPGQACSYKIGEMKIKELRQRAQVALGWRFDVRDFHATVLRVGGVPLALLERIVDAWIADQRALHGIAASDAAATTAAVHITGIALLTTVAALLGVSRGL